MPPRRPTDPRPKPPVIHYAPLKDVNIYEISEAELEKLADGPPGQLHLNFALALLPTALTLFVTIQTIEIAESRIYHGYWIAFWLLFVQGLISLFRWWSTSGSTRDLAREIRSRMPAREEIGEQLPEPPPTAPE